MKEKEFIQFEESKAVVYNIFSALLCQPEDDIIKNKKIYDTLKSALKNVCPELVKVVNKMQREVTKFSEQDLLIEYSRLFIGPYKMVAPPYSAVYFGEEILMSEATLWTINFYHKCGRKFDTGLKEMPDHAAIESEFLYYLVFTGAQALKKGNSKKAKKHFALQKEFMEKHYSLWIPQFCDKIIEGTKNNYYKTLAECLKTCVKSFKVLEEELNIENINLN